MHRTRIVLPFLALALVAAACSGEGSEPTTTAAAITPPATTPTTTIAASPTTTAAATTAAPSTEPPTTQPPDPDTGGIEGVVLYDDLSQDHVDGNVDYEVQPPVGGAHAGRWVTCGVYVDAVDEEMAVHSLEHGAVWITYDEAALSVEDVVGLAELVQTTFADDPDRIAWVLVSPYSPMPSPVVASAWGRQLILDDIADLRLAAFLRHFANGPQNPEPGAPC